MKTRKIILIDEEKCIGCGQCVDACPGGALAMVDGKAKVVRQDFCDGLGVCIGECPVDAIHFKEVPVEEVADAPASPCGCPGGSHKTLRQPEEAVAPAPASPCGCPSGAHKTLRQPEEASRPTGWKPPAALPVLGAGLSAPSNSDGSTASSSESQLNAWPIQLHRSDATMLAMSDDWPLIVEVPVGQGRVVLIPDSEFFHNINLENLERHSQANVDFIRTLLNRVRGVPTP